MEDPAGAGSSEASLEAGLPHSALATILKSTDARDCSRAEDIVVDVAPEQGGARVISDITEGLNDVLVALAAEPVVDVGRQDVSIDEPPFEKPPNLVGVALDPPW